MKLKNSLIFLFPFLIIPHGGVSITPPPWCLLQGTPGKTRGYQSHGSHAEDPRAEVFGCWCDACTVNGCTTACAQYYDLDMLCEENEMYCYDYACVPPPLDEQNLQCFLEHTQTGNDITMNVTGNPALDNTYFQCKSLAGWEEGDPICEDVGVKTDYVPGNDYCQAFEDVCDFSALVGGIPQAYTEVGCDDIFAVPGGEYWNSYDDDCVAQSPSLPPAYVINPAVYDQACCYAYSIGTFDVYDNELSKDRMINGIRIY